MDRKGGVGFKTSVLIIIIIVLAVYIILNNVYVDDTSYSKNLSKNSCLKGKLNATETDTKNCLASCVTQFEARVKPFISCSANTTNVAVCKCQRTLYSNYLGDLF